MKTPSTVTEPLPCMLRTERDGGAEHQLLVSVPNIPMLNPKSLNNAYDMRAYVPVDSDSSIEWGC